MPMLNHQRQSSRLDCNRLGPIQPILKIDFFFLNWQMELRIYLISLLTRIGPAVSTSNSKYHFPDVTAYVFSTRYVRKAENF